MSPVKGSRTSKKKKQSAVGRAEELKKRPVEDPPIHESEKDEFYDADSPPSDEVRAEEEEGEETKAEKEKEEIKVKEEKKIKVEEEEKEKIKMEEEEKEKIKVEEEKCTAHSEAEFDEFVEADQTVSGSSDTTHKALLQKVQKLIDIPSDIKLDIDGLLKKCQTEGRELMSKHPRTTSHQSTATIISNLKKELLAQGEK
ncbi:hypothetical protein PSACC_00522 [Paramicrosporidium saccamoebae]|uniref:Uncharacterized protein n=1 Tax=Paramicrosporidium saccamoebae TaxID=1246581 RepID=A0A2H9TPQ8_9FUNG|nr:hypothetical protein PSACC_00522 [Paramicrosporidium saccamoebae]